MKLYLLLVQNQEHLNSLPGAFEELKRRGTDGVWLVFSPAVLVNPETAAKEFDVIIRDITEAMESCAKRLDFDSAKSYKTKLDAQILEKTTKIGQAYRTLTREQSNAAFDALFGMYQVDPPIPKMQITQHTDHYEPGDAIAMLNSLKGAWFDPFTPGSYEIGWPTALDAGYKEPSRIVVPPAAAPVVAKANPLPPSASVPPPLAREVEKQRGNPMMSDPRYRQLVGMSVAQLGEIVQGYNLNLGGNVQKIAAGIWKHERQMASV